VYILSVVNKGVEVLGRKVESHSPCGFLLQEGNALAGRHTGQSDMTGCNLSKQQAPNLIGKIGVHLCEGGNSNGKRQSKVVF
jgi:hypothetical protein